MLPQTKVAWWIAIFILSSFTTVMAESNCTHVLNEGGAFINSMNFPDVYPDDHICTWQITVPTGDTVSLRFSHFDTEPFYDSVKVYNGNRAYGSPIATFTGFDLPEVIVSSGNSVFVTFEADGSVQRSGFAGVLTTNGHSLALNGTNGTIHSPNYPAPSPRDSLFTWTITVDVGDIVAMEFNNMSTLDSNRDSVRVYDGNSQFGFFLGGFNEFNPPSDVIKSTGNQMFIVFYQKHSPASNFIGEFTSYPAKSCMEQGNHLCDQICTDMNRTFECSCHEGFQVSSTDPYKCQECDEWTYGVLCSSSCLCNVNTTNYCNKKNGTCVCNDGWTDANCSTEALPTSSNSYEGPILDEEIYWAIIGVLGFLLLTAVIVIAVLVYKWRRKEKKTMGIAPPPPVETMPLDEIIRRCSSDAQTQKETPGTIDRDSRVYEEMTDSSHYEVPVVPATAKKPTNPKTAVLNKYGEFPKRSAKESHGPIDRESEIYVNVLAKKEDSRPEEVYQNAGCNTPPTTSSESDKVKEYTEEIYQNQK